MSRPDLRLLAFALLVTVLLRLPSFRYQTVSDDEAIYDAMARVIDAGGVMYRDTVDHKPPGLAYTYAVVRAVAPREHVLDGVHLLGILVVMATSCALHRAARKRFPDGDVAGFSALAYAVVSACKQPVDSLAVNGELMLNLPSACAVWAALAASERQGRARDALDALAGALVAVAGLYKYQALALAPALLWLFRERGRSSLLRSVLAFGAGGVAVAAVVAGWFAHRHALADALAWGIGFNRQYLAEGAGLRWSLERLSMQLVGVVLPSLAIYAAGLVGAKRIVDEKRPGAPFLLAWLVLAAICVCLGGRFFGHYFLQLELPLALAAAPMLSAWWARRPRALVVALALPSLAFFAVASLPSLTRPILNAADPDWTRVARAVDERTAANDTIWVWGNVPQLYAAADRTPGVRFTFCNYLTGLSPGTPSELGDAATVAGESTLAWQAVKADLATHPPKLIVDTSSAGWKSYGKYPALDYPVLAEALRERYRPAARVDGVTLWQRVEERLDGGDPKR